MLRVLLPLAGVLAIAALIVRAQIVLPGGIDLTGASLSVTRNSIIMENPHLTGFGGNHREYSLRADRAIQPLTSPGEVRLEQIEASIEGAGDAVSRIVAEAADYHHDKGTVQLLGPVSIESAEGYVLRMTDAHVDFGAGTMTSGNPVSIDYADSKVTGTGLSVTEHGDLIVVEGKVRTVLMPPKRVPAPAAGAAASGAD
jgi:lipopolysaccharide export system protein LptC